RGGVDRIEAILLVDGLAEDDSPPPVAPLEEVVETSGTDHVAHHLVHEPALRDRHLRLRDGAIACELDRGAAEEVEDADPALPALAADADELVRLSLEPRRHHPAVVVPDGSKALPVAGVAPHDPVLDQVADRHAV